MVLMNKERIKEVIPHREPFLLIEEVTALEPGKKCIARTYIKPESFWFEGHFPDYPVTPGALMIEMLAQTGAVCVGSLAENTGKIALVAKIDKAKFRRRVVPGDVLTLTVEMVKMKAGMGVGRAAATVDGELAVTCELTFAFLK
ncbi:MAG: 3-hydroxyacyl-ACP dehydratase FabZ [Oscillospiraceae bacterium]|nr:3-hydroxyacyl-ACP dehydratase FabZ [Oscillospiraceae bacterium]